MVVRRTRPFVFAGLAALTLAPRADTQALEEPPPIAWQMMGTHARVPELLRSDSVVDQPGAPGSPDAISSSRRRPCSNGWWPGSSTTPARTPATR